MGLYFLRTRDSIDFQINKIYKTMIKILEDTLKSPNGKWSRKSLTMLTSFIMSIVLGTYIVVSNYITKTEINEYAIDVFQGFLLLTGALSGITVWDKQNMFNTKKDDE